jgi:hydroxyacylglutathione hydrolase
MKIDAYDVENLGDGCWSIWDVKVRAFLFVGTERALLIDTGLGTGNIAAVVRTLTDLPVTLVNTHGDGDHVGCNHLFAESHMHPAEFAHYAELAPPGAAVPLPLLEGEVLDLGDRRFEVLFFPGHTPGSIMLLDREHRLLISGDSVSTVPVYMFGAVRSLRAYLAGMERLRTATDTFDTIYPSHGQLPVGPEQIDSQLRAGYALLRGELEAQEPPIPLPAKLFRLGGASFFYNP